MISFAYTLKDLRKAHKLTQSEVADVIGIDRSTYAYYERGSTKPDFECILKLCKMYEIGLNDMANLLLRDQKTDVTFKTLDKTIVDKQAYLNELDMINVDEYEKMMLVYYRQLPDAFKKLFFLKIKQNFDDIVSMAEN